MRSGNLTWLLFSLYERPTADGSAFPFAATICVQLTGPASRHHLTLRNRFEGGLIWENTVTKNEDPGVYGTAWNRKAKTQSAQTNQAHRTKVKVKEDIVWCEHAARSHSEFMVLLVLMLLDEASHLCETEPFMPVGHVPLYVVA